MHLQPHHLGFQWHFNAFGPSKYAVLSGINPCKKSFHLSFSLKRFSIWHLWLWVLLSAHLPPLTCKGDNSQMQKIKQRRKNALNWLVNSTVCMKGGPSNTFSSNALQSVLWWCRSSKTPAAIWSSSLRQNSCLPSNYQEKKLPFKLQLLSLNVSHNWGNNVKFQQWATE